MKKSRLHTSLVRLRHRRGHGIHSPFVFRLAREVFYRPHKGQCNEMCQALIAAGIRPKHACEAERLCRQLGMDGFSFCDAFPQTVCPRCLYVLREWKGTPPGEGTFLLLGRVAPQPDALTVDRKHYSLIIYDRDLPAQHFIL
jgi:hypothetical protein